VERYGQPLSSAMLLPFMANESGAPSESIVNTSSATVLAGQASLMSKPRAQSLLAPFLLPSQMVKACSAPTTPSKLKSWRKLLSLLV
jgi:hypothetical protein